MMDAAWRSRPFSPTASRATRPRLTPVPIVTLSRFFSISCRGATPVRSMATLPAGVRSLAGSMPDRSTERLPCLAISLRSSGTDLGVWIAGIKRQGVYESGESKVNEYVRLSGV